MSGWGGRRPNSGRKRQLTDEQRKERKRIRNREQYLRRRKLKLEQRQQQQQQQTEQLQQTQQEQNNNHDTGQSAVPVINTNSFGDSNQQIPPHPIRAPPQQIQHQQHHHHQPLMMPPAPTPASSNSLPPLSSLYHQSWSPSVSVNQQGTPVTNSSMPPMPVDGNIPNSPPMALPAVAYPFPPIESSRRTLNSPHNNQGTSQHHQGLLKGRRSPSPPSDSSSDSPSESNNGSKTNSNSNSPPTASDISLSDPKNAASSGELRPPPPRPRAPSRSPKRDTTSKHHYQIKDGYMDGMRGGMMMDGMMDGMRGGGMIDGMRGGGMMMDGMMDGMRGGGMMMDGMRGGSMIDGMPMYNPAYFRGNAGGGGNGNVEQDDQYALSSYDERPSPATRRAAVGRTIGGGGGGGLSSSQDRRLHDMLHEWGKQTGQTPLVSKALGIPCAAGVSSSSSMGRMSNNDSEDVG